MSNVPVEMSSEAALASRWKTLSTLTGLALWGVMLLFVPLLAYLGHHPVFTRTLFEEVLGYLSALPFAPLAPLRDLILSPNSPASFLDSLLLIVGTFGVCLLGVAVAYRTNPYRSNMMIHGDARWADAADLDAMDAGDQIGPSGKYLHFGYGPDGRRLSLIEPLSVLSFAPPGTGKTTRLVIPSLLATEDCCFVVHDPKPELWDSCSGWCAQRGPAFRLDWSKMDHEDSDDPERSSWHPKFNFLDPSICPLKGPDRDKYLDALVKILIQDAKGGGSGDYFVPRGQAALIGFLHYLVETVTDRMHFDHPPGQDPWTECALPVFWKGKPASFPMLVDFLAYSQSAFEAQLRAAGTQTQDAQKDWLNSLLERAKARGYATRCMRELVPVAAAAYNERSGILGTMMKGLAPFNIQSVSERTAATDFTPADLRGRLSPAALDELGCACYPRSREEWDAVADRLEPRHWEPVTVIVCINQAEALTYELLSALFFDVISRELLSYPPNSRALNGAVLGPFPCCMLMDEFAKLAKSESVIQGPELGRSMKVFYVLIAQSSQQIDMRYSKEQSAIIVSTTAVKFILPQMSTETIKQIADMVGKVTVERTTVSRNVGLKVGDPFAGSKSKQMEGVQFLDVRNVGTMPEGTHILLVQGFMNRPVRCRSSMCFRDPLVLPRYYSLRSPPELRGPPPATELPTLIRAERMRDLLARRRIATEASDAAERERAFARRRYRWNPATFAQTPRLGP